ncbi:cytochrome c3 family protein [Shewanella sp. AS1]|uniref:cytochrome c3 family protein n=1 Tax=Shewanella sp. AS1 TaxID=2907626 RepID=UPI001F396F78|nr:cytochrome c3 family protein [Shewanella sp. AS1]MCE9679329.1 cytochrome c3 family protein [Shewanella sp. AS1]
MYPSKHFFSSLIFFTVTLMLCSLAPSLMAEPGTNCIKCHKRNGQLVGIHGNQALGILCQDCHGEQGTHPKKESSINTFGADSQMTVTQRVAVCLTCHDHQALAEAEWTHNVHASQLGCGQCHQLHPEQDPILSMDDKQRSQLCVSCHQLTQ